MRISPGEEPQTALIVASEDELRLIMTCLNELTNGSSALDEEDWAMMIGWPRELAKALREQIYEFVASRPQ